MDSKQSEMHDTLLNCYSPSPSFFFFFFFFFSPLSATLVSIALVSNVLSAASAVSLSFFFFFFFSGLATSVASSAGASASSSFCLSFFFFFFFEPSASTSSTLILFTSGFSSSSSAFLFNVTSAAALYSSTSLLDSYLSNLALCLAVAEILVTSPPSSCLMRDSTFARCSIPRSVLVSSPKASTLQAKEAFAASILDTLPLSFVPDCPTSCAWYIRPYLGVSCFVFSALNRAFSAPNICTVEAGCLARFIKVPAWAINLAPTNSPTSTVKLGAIAIMRFFRYSYNCPLYSWISTTCWQRCLMLTISSPLISVPILISAASFTFSSTSSGNTSLRSIVLALSLVPINSTVRTKARLSVMIFPNSGKCQPYHSLQRMI